MSPTPHLQLWTQTISTLPEALAWSANPERVFSKLGTQASSGRRSQWGVFPLTPSTRSGSHSLTTNKNHLPKSGYLCATWQVYISITTFHIITTTYKIKHSIGNIKATNIIRCCTINPYSLVYTTMHTISEYRVYPTQWVNRMDMIPLEYKPSIGHNPSQIISIIKLPSQ